MYENCYMIRCEEFTVMPVTTYNDPGEGAAFLSSDNKALYLPSDMPAFQVDYTQYYYPTGILSPGTCLSVFPAENLLKKSLKIPLFHYYVTSKQSIVLTQRIMVVRGGQNDDRITKTQ
jgi:hypothetical protein